MIGKCSTYCEPEGRPVGVPRKNDRILLNQTVKEIRCKILEWIHLAQNSVK